MKIRSGFVSNSSSSSYIIAIPPIIDQEEIVKHAILEDGPDYLDEEQEEQVLKGDLNWFNYDLWECGMDIYDQRYKIIKDHIDEYILTSMETSSDCGQIINILNEDNVKSLKNVLKNKEVREYFKELISKAEIDED